MSQVPAPRARAVFVSLLTLAAFLPACGGGGGGGSGTVYTNADFAGTYQVMCFGGSQASNSVSGIYGYITANGTGMISGMVGENVDGTGSPLAATGTTAYAVSADGTIQLDNFEGFLALGGQAAVLTEATNGQDPFICLLLRRNGSYSNALLTGNYHLGGIEGLTTFANAYWTEPGAMMGPVAFDGAGNGAYPTAQRNLDGVVGADGGGGAVYSIAADGTLSTGVTWFGLGMGTLTGDGTFACVSGAGPSSMGAPFLEALVKQGSGLSNSTFAGTYLVAAVRVDDTSRDFTTLLTTLAANGSGGITYGSGVINVESTVTPTSGGSDTYSVSPTGEFSVGGYPGAVSPDGRFAFIAGGPTNGDDMFFALYVRR